MENTPISIFYIACGLTALITLLQLREASQINRFFAGAAILAASAAAFYSRSDTSEFGYFIMAGLLMSLIGSMLLGIRRNKAAAVIGAVLFIAVNILYLAAFRINARAEFASKPFDIVFFAALVVFLDFGGFAFFAGEKRFALRNLPLLANIIIAAFTASSGVSLGFKYLSDSTFSIMLGLMLVLGPMLFAYANLSVCKSFAGNNAYELNTKTTIFEKLAIPAYYGGQILLASGVLLVRIPV